MSEETKESKKVLAVGFFDMLHYGHLNYLRQAKEKGDYLIVLVSHEKNKNKKALLSQKERAEMVESLKIVDKVVLGDEKRDFEKILREIKPDVIVVGYDFSFFNLLKKIVSLHFPEIELYKAKKFGDFSTSSF